MSYFFFKKKKIEVSLRKLQNQLFCEKSQENTVRFHLFILSK